MRYWIGFIVLSLTSVLFAGTLNCFVTKAKSCKSGTDVIVLRMSGATNAHAELPDESTKAYKKNVICCNGVEGLTTTCSGTYETVMKLSGTTNAHVELGTENTYSESVCLHVPSGGDVIVGYGPSCAGYDTTLASLSKIPTNAHIGNADAYVNKICATARDGGGLAVDIISPSNVSITNPFVAMTSTTLKLGDQTTTGYLGTSSERVRVENASGNIPWAVTIAATNGATSLWSGGISRYDFNDPAAHAVDGVGDSDTYGGRLSVNPFGGTLTPKPGCNNAGISKGAVASFSEGVTDSITLLTAGSTAGPNCYWDMTGVSLSQTIPLEQAVANYSISMTLSVVAM